MTPADFLASIANNPKNSDRIKKPPNQSVNDSKKLEKSQKSIDFCRLL